MRTLLFAVVAILVIAGWALVVYGITPGLGESQSAAAGAAFVSLLGMSGAALVVFALAGTRGRL